MRHSSIILLLVTCLTFNVNAQETSSVVPTQQNWVKLNVLSLPFRCLSVGYERSLSPHIGVGVGIRWQPKGPLPFKKTIEGYVSESSITARDFINNSDVSNWAVTPEVRYYFGRKPMNGFYTGAFLRYGAYHVWWAYRFVDDQNQPHIYQLKGKAGVFSAGILLGAQFNLSKGFFLDWQFAGPHFASLNANLQATGDFRDLDQFERQRLKNMLQGFAINENHLEVEISDDEVNGHMKLTTLGLRSQLSIGYKF